MRIGEAELPRGKKTVMMPIKPECAAEYPVTVGGAAVGTWKAADTATFVSADPKLCHRETDKKYGKAYVGELVAVPAKPHHEVALSQACGGWIDWYSSTASP